MPVIPKIIFKVVTVGVMFTAAFCVNTVHLAFTDFKNRIDRSQRKVKGDQSNESEYIWLLPMTLVHVLFWARRRDRYKRSQWDKRQVSTGTPAD